MRIGCLWQMQLHDAVKKPTRAYTHTHKHAWQFSHWLPNTETYILHCIDSPPATDNGMSMWHKMTVFCAPFPLFTRRVHQVSDWLTHSAASCEDWLWGFMRGTGKQEQRNTTGHSSAILVNSPTVFWPEPGQSVVSAALGENGWPLGSEAETRK